MPPATAPGPYKVVPGLALAQARDLLRRLGAVERPAYRTKDRALYWSGTLKIWAQLALVDAGYTLSLYRGCPC